MKIVIDIPNNDYEYIKGLNEGITDYHTTVKLYRAVGGGTVLPKGHGDLIDRSKLAYYRCPNNVKDCPPTYDFKCNSCDFGITNKFRVDNAPAIIEADSE